MKQLTLPLVLILGCGFLMQSANGQSTLPKNPPATIQAAPTPTCLGITIINTKKETSKEITGIYCDKMKVWVDNPKKPGKPLGDTLSMAVTDEKCLYNSSKAIQQILCNKACNTGSYNLIAQFTGCTNYDSSPINFSSDSIDPSHFTPVDQGFTLKQTMVFDNYKLKSGGITPETGTIRFEKIASTQ